MEKTPLNKQHKELGAKLIEFGGWEMPVSYSGIIDEHLACRNSAALFDVSHMGEIFVEGEQAEQYLNFVTSNDVSRLRVGGAQYSLLLNGKGGVVDDIIVYRLDFERYMLCVNASNTQKDFDWLTAHKSDFKVEVADLSKIFVQIALQGPKAFDVLRKVTNEHLPSRAFTFKEVSNLGLVARTGYTGEDGVEIFSDVQTGIELWDQLLSHDEVSPAGLGARDTLRLESCYPLYGHELSDELHPYAAKLKWVVKEGKDTFLGKEQLSNDFEHKLCGFEVTGAGIVREGAELYVGEEKVGWVTSGTKLPYLEKVMFLGYIKDPGQTGIEALVRGRRISVQSVKTPFYKR